MKKIALGSILVISLLILNLLMSFSLAFASVLFLEADNEVQISLYCTGTGEYNMNAINKVFDSYYKNGKKKKPVGVLTDKQHLFIKYAEKYRIDAVLMMAISLHETGLGKSNAVVNYNNPGGLMKSGGKLYKFDSLEKGIEATAKTLHNRIIKDGKDTIIDLGKVYAPVGAANDPKNLNSNWITNVSDFVVKLGGVKNCEVFAGEYFGGSGGDGSFVNPISLSGMQVTSPFGTRIHPITKVESFHQGIDLRCSAGEPILSASDGIVTYAESKSSGWSTTYGNYVIVQHVNNVKTLYAHLTNSILSVGQEILAGQQVGSCGTTGLSTGNHLHFEVRLNNNRVDPYPYLIGSSSI